MSHSPATLAIQRRLERWELEHLRLLCKQQNEQIDELKSRIEWAEDAAECWRDDALELHRALAESLGEMPGLTRDGQLVTVPAEAA